MAIEMLLTNAVGEKGELGTATRIGQSGGGGSITPSDVVQATENMSNLQKTATINNLGAVAAPVKTVVSDANATIEPHANGVYVCGELTSLTVSNPPATGAYSIVFTSGATATTTTIPSTILGLESFAAEANTHYEINVEDNYALVASWDISGS